MKHRNHLGACARAALAALSLSAGAGGALAAGHAIAPELLGAPLAKPSAPVSFEIYLPLRDTAGLNRLLSDQQTPGRPDYQRWLTPGEFAARFGPSAASLARVKAEIARAGMMVTATHARSLRVSGQAGQAAALLGVRLRAVSATPGARPRLMAEAPPLMSTVLQQEGAKVAAFAALPQRRPMSRRAAAPANRYAANGAYWFTDLKQAYDYPSYQAMLPGGRRLDGTGVRAAVLMADLIYPDDLGAAFDHEQFTAVTGLPAPSVNTVLVDGGGMVNGYGSFEASLDVQQIAGGAPGAAVTLVSLPDLSDQSILDGYTAIIESNAYDIVNSSFGGCETTYTAAYNNGVDYTWILQMDHEAFLQGNAQGITFVASSGDEGGLPCPDVTYFNGQATRFVKGVENPADDPNVTAVGGGNLITSADGSLNATYVRESAYGDPEFPYDPYGEGVNAVDGYWGAGGGVSVVFARPSYQFTTKTGSSQFRTVPDVGMEVGGLGFSIPGYCNGNAISCGADDSAVLTAYGVSEGGGFYYTIGTSVASPEFVGALALSIEKRGTRLGNVNTFLYNQGGLQTQAGGAAAPAARQFYHRGQPGFDGYWTGAQPNANYDYIYGNGSPDVRRLFGFTNLPAAGTPKGATNP